jgi:hypothetical protein
MTGLGGDSFFGKGRGSSGGARKIARNPVSSSSDSHPYPQKTCPTWMIER